MLSEWYLVILFLGISMIPFSYLVARVVAYAYFNEKYTYQIRFMNHVSGVNSQASVNTEPYYD